MHITATILNEVDFPGGVNAATHFNEAHAGEVTLIHDDEGTLSIWGDQIYCWASSQLVDEIDQILGKEDEDDRAVVLDEVIDEIIQAVRTAARDQIVDQSLSDLSKVE